MELWWRGYHAIGIGQGSQWLSGVVMWNKLAHARARARAHTHTHTHTHRNVETGGTIIFSCKSVIMRNAAGIPLLSGSSIITFIFTLLKILLTCGSWVSGQTRLNSYTGAQTNYLFASNNLTEQLKHRGQFTTPKNKLKIVLLPSPWNYFLQF